MRAGVICGVALASAIVAACGASGGTDAAVGTTDGGRPFCPNEGPHETCADFDGADPFAGFTPISRGGASIVASPAVSMSPPMALRGEAEADTAAYLERELPSRRVVDLSFSASAEGSGEAQLGGLTLFGEGAYYELIFIVALGRYSFTEWSPELGGVPRPLGGAALAKGVWHRFRVRAELPPGGGRPTCEIWEDAVSRYRGEIAAPTLPALSEARVVLGMFFARYSKGTVVIDDVVIDSEQ